LCIDHRDAFSPLTAPSSGLLRIDGLVSYSAYLNRMLAGWLQSAPMGHTLACERTEVHSLLISYQHVEFPPKHLFKQVSLLIGMFHFIIEIGERASP
jgi:hypothetical protein